MKKLLLLFTILLGLNTTGQTQLNPVDITHDLIQDYQGVTANLIRGAFTATETETGYDVDCSTHFTQDLYIGSELTEPTELFITPNTVLVANANLIIYPNAIVIGMDRITITDGSDFESSSQTTITFSSECSAGLILQPGAQVYDNEEDYNSTLSIEQYIFMHPELSYKVYDITGKYLGTNREGLNTGLYIIQFENGFSKKFISK